MAKELTFPEIVTEKNIEEMKKLVKNGRHIYPGASSVKTSENEVFMLRNKFIAEKMSNIL